MDTTKRTLLIFGAGGDLTSRLLLPGIGQLLSSERGTSLELIGVDREERSDADWQAQVKRSFDVGGADPEETRVVLEAARYLQADVTDSGSLQRVLGECAGPPAIYFALPPHVTVLSCAALEHVELPPDTILALEKPFGTELKSARTLNRLLQRLVPESRVQRVDHFLGKSTVLNILGLRFANRLFEAVWNASSLERVEITYDESLGLEGRAGYYDRAGAMVDMIQSHLLLVLALVAMEPPSTLDAEDLRGSMAQALRATRAMRGGSRRARYEAGIVGDREFPAYADEPGVDPERKTETLAEVTVAVDNWRWAGVPFVLRSGKAMESVRKEIVLTFRDVPHALTGLTGAPGRARLVIGLDPDMLKLDLVINGEGNPFDLDLVTLDATFGKGELSAYGEVLHGILEGDPLLSVRGDMAEECWRIVDEVLEEWRTGHVPLDTYPAGSTGPHGWASTEG
ncbi:glucose-6-phosphate dehydrogenase [Lysobacter korlensis]|uniref:Glucose-6-phosphate dehydrogenase n=1 Tax=Lysobacter korlensis TaxID=553636 RepID=A0ABV6RMP6_9GAMM